LNERQCVVSDFIHKLDALVIRSMIDAALQHAASVAVSGDLYTVGSHCVVYELPHEVSLPTPRCNTATLLTWLSSGASLLRHF
jgi:hypothetical protein